MRRKLSWVLLSAAIVITAIYARRTLATPASDFVGTTLALGRFGEIDVFNHLVPERGADFEKHNGNFWEKHHRKIWVSSQKTKGLSDVYVQSNVWGPGGSSGWHTHPGHSLIIVTAGTVTAYEGDDSDCKPNMYTQGMGFVDAGGDHVHLLRNEGTVQANTITIQLLPADAVRRIDAENPGHCPF